MSWLKNPFRRKAAPQEGQRALIHQWARAALDDPSGLELTLSEVDCPDPACPGLETFILVLREGQPTVAAKIRKPIAEIAENDVIEALRYL